MKTAYIAYSDWGDGVIISRKAFQTEHEAKAELEMILCEIAEANEITYTPPESPQRDEFEDILLDCAGTLHFGVKKIKLDW